MLILAALLVFYHLAAMVVETAHSGVPFGRRANQIWMPIRFVFAIGLLVPAGHSLNAGQYIVVGIASKGSNMASAAWRTVANSADGHLSGLATPRGPNIAQAAATAIEMEICRAVYTQFYTPLGNDLAVHAAGPIADITKLPADRFINETWRATNILNANVPMCGEYHFAGYRRPIYGAPKLKPEAISRMASHLSDFARTETDDLETDAKPIGDRIALVFLSPGAPIGADVHNDILSMEGAYAKKLEAEKDSIDFLGAGLADRTMADSVNAGWIAAANFIPDFVRLQASYSELMSHALPVAESPIFAHPHLARQMLNEATSDSPIFTAVEGVPPEKLASFYAQVSRVTSQVHSWLYSTQIPDKDNIPLASADLHELLNAATEPSDISAIYAQAMDAAAMSSGVWGEDIDLVDTGYPFATLPAGISYNPFAALVEFGNRQITFANNLAGLMGSGISISGATGPSILLGIASLLFFIGGFTLIFLAPFLPFLRFLMAALAWLVNVFEAVIAVPIVAIAHLTPNGGGLSGSLARQAYMLWLGLLVRPILTLFGFVSGMLLFTFSLALIGTILTPFARMAMPVNDGLLTFANTGLVLLYDVLVYAAANASFKGISWLPDQALRWTSRFVITEAPGSDPTPITHNGGGNVATSITNLTSSSTSHNAKTGVNSGGTSGNASQSHALKMALMPSYADKPSSTLDTTASTASSIASHITDHSVPSGTAVHVSISAPGSNIPSRVTTPDAHSEKNRLAGGEQIADLGSQERGAADKPQDKTPE